MRLLVIMTNYPFPPQVGSAIFAYNSMKHLSRHHSIDFVCLKPSKELVNPAEFAERTELVSRKKITKIGKWMRYVRSMLVGVPYSVSEFASKAMREKVREVLGSRKFDAILLFEMSAIQYCPPFCYDKLIVNIEDPLSIRLIRMAELPVWSLWQRVKLFLSARLSVCYENRLLPRMAKVLLLSETDRNDMHERGGYDNLECVSYGVDQEAPEEILGYEERERAIIFSGNMFHPPNVDGALFFLRDIFPLILEQYQSAKLWIVGANPDARIYDASAKYGKRVVITGRVDDIAAYIRRATVSICTVRLKIGVQTKILEALSWGTPVVATSSSNSGILGVSGSHLWVEDDPYQFAKRVVELLQGIGWTKLSEEGRRLVAKRFSWEGSATQLEQHLESLL